MLLLQHTVPLSKKLVDFDTPLAGQANVTASMNISSAFVAETAKAKAKRTRARVSMSNKHLLAGKELFVDSTFAVRFGWAACGIPCQQNISFICSKCHFLLNSLCQYFSLLSSCFQSSSSGD